VRRDDFRNIVLIVSVLSRGIARQWEAIGFANLNGENLFRVMLCRGMGLNFAYIDVDHEIVSTRPVVYSDSVEPFDKDREIALNRLIVKRGRKRSANIRTQ
jgi:hypothetical protein